MALLLHIIIKLFNYVLQWFCFVRCACMAINNVSVQHNGGFLPCIILLTQCYYHRGGLSLSDESFPNGGARGAFAKPSRSLQEGSAKPSRSVSSRRLRGASKAPPRTLRGGLRTLRGGCTDRRFHEDALEGSRGLLEGSVDELHVPTRS